MCQEKRTVNHLVYMCEYLSAVNMAKKQGTDIVGRQLWISHVWACLIGSFFPVCLKNSFGEKGTGSPCWTVDRFVCSMGK